MFGRIKKCEQVIWRKDSRGTCWKLVETDVIRAIDRYMNGIHGYDMQMKVRPKEWFYISAYKKGASYARNAQNSDMLAERLREEKLGFERIYVVICDHSPVREVENYDPEEAEVFFIGCEEGERDLKEIYDRLRADIIPEARFTSYKDRDILKELQEGHIQFNDECERTGDAQVCFYIRQPSSFMQAVYLTRFRENRIIYYSDWDYMYCKYSPRRYSRKPAMFPSHPTRKQFLDFAMWIRDNVIEEELPENTGVIDAIVRYVVILRDERCRLLHVIKENDEAGAYRSIALREGHVIASKKERDELFGRQVYYSEDFYLLCRSYGLSPNRAMRFMKLAVSGEYRSFIKGNRASNTLQCYSEELHQFAKKIVGMPSRRQLFKQFNYEYDRYLEDLKIVPGGTER